MHGATYSEQSTAMGNDQGGMFHQGIAESPGPLGYIHRGYIRKLSFRHSQAKRNDPPVSKILVSLSISHGTQLSFRKIPYLLCRMATSTDGLCVGLEALFSAGIEMTARSLFILCMIMNIYDCLIHSFISFSIVHLNRCLVSTDLNIL